MLFVYLDESGDLGFDFITKKPSRHFTICVLSIRGRERDRALAKAVNAVVRRKLPSKKGRAVELKGIKTDLSVKRFFYKKVAGLEFSLYTVTLDKLRAYNLLAQDKERIYNYLARMTLEQVDFRDAAVRVTITVDKSKSKAEAQRFNKYVLAQIQSRIDPHIPLEIYHASSEQSPGLQAADMFAWGVFRKHEYGDSEWYGVFRGKIAFEKLFVP